MVRPKNADSEETWNRIIAAARQDLTHDESGAIDISMRQVALTSGVSLGTIHYYFPTKEALLDACLDAYYASLRELAVELATRIGQGTRENGRALLDECVRRVYRFALSERPRLKLRARMNTQRGHLSPNLDVHERDWFTPLLAPLTDVAPSELRMAFQTMTFVIMHHVLLSDAELVQIVGVGGDAGRQRIEDHIARVARLLVFEV
ncbi:hypothetical protein A7982_13705 [Minicystis rosea]|nr:hypothetical protein A7982_13705 [Minicystis rosea]